jgi:tRNA threonylcarbamoyladenosine biosynthesis protein TsaE
VGIRLGSLLQTGDVICLVGDLGTGKTTLVQGVAAGWGTLDPVSSPTFVLVNVYRRFDGQRIYHLDAYRLNSPTEAMDLDIIDMVDRGSLIIEWADRIASFLPEEQLQITFFWASDTQRNLIVSANGERYQILLSDLRRQVYGVS